MTTSGFNHEVQSPASSGAPGSGTVVPFQAPLRATPTSPKRPGQAMNEQADLYAEGPVCPHLWLGVGQLLQRRRSASEVFAFAIVQFAERSLLEETFGAEVGHRLGSLIQDRLQRVLRSSDRLVLLNDGGFAVLLDALEDRAAALHELHRIYQDIGGGYQVDGLRLRLTPRMGAVVAGSEEYAPEDLVRHARVALRHAEAGSSGGLECFEPAMLARLRERVRIAGELQQAIQAGRLELHYQPQYELGSGAMVSTEALLRLRDAAGGLVGPDCFIGIAEETGLIVEMGRWVIREACRQLAQWRAEGFELQRMAVNLSPRQLLDMELVPTIRRAVADSGLDYEDLELEITEAQMIENLPLVAEILEEIAELGVRIAVDDFGTGYSSLAYISRLPLHRLKIDRSLVVDAEGSRRAARIVAAVVAIADELGLDVVAEGIETGRQRALVAEAGCKLGQGFLLGRPVPPGQLLQRAVRA